MPTRDTGCRSFVFWLAYAETCMRILEALASIFINTFGITQPTDAMRRQTAWFILGLLILALGIVAAVGVVIYHLLRH